MFKIIINGTKSEQTAHSQSLWHDITFNNVGDTDNKSYETNLACGCIGKL